MYQILLLCLACRQYLMPLLPKCTKLIKITRIHSHCIIAELCIGVVYLFSSTFNILATTVTFLNHHGC